VANQLLTNNLRMQIHRKKYNCMRRGTVQLQAAYRGHATRRVLATIKIQTMSRMCKRRSIYRRLKSATIALQCALRCKMAIKVLRSFKGEQKDIGKLKQNNDKLKLEMASLKAMLQAQAKGDANKKENTEAINAKQQIISKLEKRVAELEAELEREKAIVQKLEQDMETQKKRTALQLELLQKQSEKMQRNALLAAPASPKPHSAHSARSPRAASRTRGGAPLSPGANVVIQEVVKPELLAEHKAMVTQLEQELEKERKFRNDADSEIIKLRAAMSGVNLNESDVAALLVSPSKTQASISQPRLESLHESQDSYSDSDDEDEGPPSLRCVKFFMYFDFYVYLESSCCSVVIIQAGALLWGSTHVPKRVIRLVRLRYSAFTHLYYLS
jgi:chromosome segregation ATPase